MRRSEQLSMKKIFHFFILLFLVQPLLVVAQSSATKVLKEEEGKFFRELDRISIDSILVHQLSRSVKLEIDSIYTFIISDTALKAAEKEKAILSLGYFMNELAKNITRQRSEVYDIHGALLSYRNILIALLYNRSFTDVLLPASQNRSQVLSAAFSQYKEYPLLDDIAVYKRVASLPEFILSFLENNPGFRYADSLLVIAAVNDPSKTVSYLSQGKQPLQDKIRNTNNIYLQQLISLAADKNAAELLPFVTQIAENKITPEEILETRKDVVKYFQLLVNTQMETGGINDASFKKLLRKGLKEKSLSFYVNEINELHSAADATRFASVKGLRPYLLHNNQLW